jgi:ectoine hydroxylase-related dioxygenase (phytanoyl-CoA dioxygenase family)
MTPEQVLAQKPKILTQKQREFYFENGYILLEKFLSDQWIERLRAATEEMVDRSKSVAASDAVWDIDKAHTREHPRLRRLSSMNDHHPTYWEYASSKSSPLPDAIADLVGPDVKFHHSKLNFKWSKGGDEVKWHQDIPSWPHTNYSPCTAGTYVYECNAKQGPLGVLRGNHNGPVVDQYNEAGEWTGCLKPAEAAAIDMSKVDYLEGPAGSITIHNCRTLHYSKANWSEIPRPLLLNVYSAADAMPYTANPLPSKYSGAIVRGKPARWAYHDPRPCMLPPDWSGGYTSIFAIQQAEDWSKDRPKVAAGGGMM